MAWNRADPDVVATARLGPTLVDDVPPVIAESSPHRAGDVIEGCFQLRSLLGAGAMGTVFEADDLRLRRRVALKIAHEGEASARLRREAMALAAVRHPAVVAVHYVGETLGRSFMVMERIYGVSLQAFLERRLRAGHGLSIDEALDLALPLAEGLAATHRAGIVHRDVKPSNVMLAPGDRVVLMDFGLFLAENDPALTGATSGSPAYMAPETILGESAPGSGFLVDVYAFGVVLYELLADALPFDSTSITGVFGQHLAAPIPELSLARADAPAALTELVRAMLAKQASERPESMDLVVQRLVAIRAARTAGAAPNDRFAVMIVDDDPDMVALLRALVVLAVPDAEVRVVSDGERAIELAQAWPPHLMLLDLMMPRMTGVEVCMYLRGAHVADRCSIVSVSAGAEEHDIQLLHQLGITRFVRKGPALAEQLPAVVADVHRLARAASLER